MAATSNNDKRSWTRDVEEFLTDRRPEDLLLVYLSCHGLVDLRRRLYFAATDTVKNRLAATGVEAQWLLDRMEDCRARRQVMILDCCFSGAFAHGANGDTELGLGERFQGQGRGRVVLTASRASEYSFEGDPVPGSAVPGSVFTSGLVAGIRTGAADVDHDGFISVDDAYVFAFDQVRAAGAQQTPQRWLYGAEGTILLARNPAGVTVTPAAVPEAARALLEPGPPPSKAARDDAPRTGTPRRLRPFGQGARNRQAAPAGPTRAARPVRRRRRLVYAAVATVVLAAAGTAAALLAPDGGGSPAGARRPASGEFTAASPWGLAILSNVDSGDECTVTVTNTGTGTQKMVTVSTGNYSYQVQNTGSFRWETDDSGCLVVQRPGAGTGAGTAELTFTCCSRR